MIHSSGRYALVFNGEIYNFRELRSQLEALGASFRSTGDAEVLLNALALWHTDALPRLNGIFALAFYDLQEKTLLLARDYAGIKPLYLMHDKRGVVFGSQYNVLTSHPWGRGRAIFRTVANVSLWRDRRRPIFLKTQSPGWLWTK
jgi:asparagine synthase (glutamine-hydrolysing)